MIIGPDPVPVSDTYLRIVSARSAQVERDLGPATKAAEDPCHSEGSGISGAINGSLDDVQDYTGAPADVVDLIEQIVDGLRDELVALSDDLHAHPETAFEEHRSAARIAEVLAGHDIAVRTGAHDCDTALRAELTGVASVSDPVPPSQRSIAVLSEYDALPQIGHACGHNVIATAGLGAFLALVELERTHPGAIPGRVVYLGTPAEEGHTGKEVMARAGAFDGLDAAIMVHPFAQDIASQPWLGRRVLSVVFHGLSAHASAQPFMGRNALDAASLMYQGLGLLRQQMPPCDRLHAVIREGGDRASVIPDRAVLDLYVRSLYPETLRELSQRVEDVARGAALMTGCGLDLAWDRCHPSLPVRTNSALTSRWVRAQQRRGRTPLSEHAAPRTTLASTDFGNVSFRVPGIHPLIGITGGAPCGLHTPEFAQAAATEHAHRAIADAAFGLAVTALDFLRDDDLAARVIAEFEADGGAIDVPHFFD